MFFLILRDRTSVNQPSLVSEKLIGCSGSLGRPGLDSDTAELLSWTPEACGWKRPAVTF